MAYFSVESVVTQRILLWIGSRHCGKNLMELLLGSLFYTIYFKPQETDH